MRSARKYSAFKTLFFAIATLLINSNTEAQTVHKSYHDGSIYFKIKDEVSLNLPSERGNINLENAFFLDEIRKSFRIEALEKPFFAVQSEVFQHTFQLTFADHENVDKIIEALYQTGIVEYAEKVPISTLHYTPNDPELSKQWHLTKIKASLAWDYSKGSSKTIVAVIDNAIDLNHVDLKNRIWSNSKEIPNNSIDDDKNGYIDDVRGWDFSDKDNNPNPISASINHGTHVSGDIAAESDNQTGVASIAFHATILPIKASKDNSSGSTLLNEYLGIPYAADMGARIINCSWGGDVFSQTEKNAVTYALDKGCIIVTSAGNENTENLYYPTGYDVRVICVAATDENDKRAIYLTGASNYGSWVDVSAPGNFIYGPVPGNKYESLKGTSFASPLVAGLCALMLSYNPLLTAAQVEKCIKSSAVSIDALNPGYAGKLGTGRIDAAAAMQCASLLTSVTPVDVKSDAITIYPNPSTGEYILSLQSQSEKNCLLYIKNLLGETVFTKSIRDLNGTYNTSFNLNSFPSGVYILIVKLEEKQFIKKIVLEK